MIRFRIALLAVGAAAGLLTPTLAVGAAAGLLTPTLAVAAAPSAHGVSVASVASVASVQDEPDPGETKPANCGTANTPPCEA
jgi:hypothetical protein